MTGVVTATITDIESSTEMEPQYNLLSIDVINEVNKIPTAQLVLLDGDAAKQKFDISNSDFFKPGKKIEIKLRYERKPDFTVFTGFVVKHSIRANDTKSVLTLYLKDAAIQLTQQRKNAIFRDEDDLSIIKGIVEAAGLKLSDKSNPKKTAIVHSEMVQYYCTDWDFILSRAEANGLWVMANNGEINIQVPNAIGGDSTPIVYGLDEIYDLEIEADIREQFNEVKALAWDAQTQLPTDPQAGDAYALKQNKLDPTSLGKKIGADQCQLISGNQLTPEEAQTWASAKLLKHRLSMIKGRVLVAGRGDLHPGSWLKLEKFSNYFNGETLVTGTRHQVSEQGWQTDIQFGASAEFFAASGDIIAPPASALLPAVHGLQIGVVGDAVEDPDGLFRVPVKVPRLLDENDGTIWARLATLEAGLGADKKTGRGMMFRPEPGDEVILGFLNDDPRQAIILGSLYSGKNKPPIKVKPENMMRGIFSKENLKLYFNDKDKSIRIETPNTNRIILADEDGAIYIVDENNNKLTMNADGIQISSDKNIAITAQENITLQGSKVDVK